MKKILIICIITLMTLVSCSSNSNDKKIESRVEESQEYFYNHIAPEYRGILEIKEVYNGGFSSIVVIKYGEDSCLIYILPERTWGMKLGKRNE